MKKRIIVLLKATGTFYTDKMKKRTENNGDKIHLSIHPNRIYLKRLNSDGTKEHLIEEYEPQPFNQNNFRLHAIFTAPPITHMDEYTLGKKKNNLMEVVFDWHKTLCPQVSVYELDNKFALGNIEKLLPPGDKVQIIPSDGLHPAIVLQLKATNGDPGVWGPNCGIFGRVVKKKPISKKELQDIISYNNLSIDISSIPDNSVITDYKMENADKL